jgi:hypothetical protein
MSIPDEPDGRSRKANGLAALELGEPPCGLCLGTQLGGALGTLLGPALEGGGDDVLGIGDLCGKEGQTSSKVASAIVTGLCPRPKPGPVLLIHVLLRPSKTPVADHGPCRLAIAIPIDTSCRTRCRGRVWVPASRGCLICTPANSYPLLLYLLAQSEVRAPPPGPDTAQRSRGVQRGGDPLTARRDGTQTEGRGTLSSRRRQ